MAGPERVYHRSGSSGAGGHPRPCGIKGVSDRSEIGEREDGPMDFKDRRIWYAVAAVIIVLIVIGYAAGWFSGGPAPTPQ